MTSFFCPHPFAFMEFSLGGNVFCCCPAHVQRPLGNLREQTIDEIWNGEVAQKMRHEIINHRWEAVCKPSCPVVQEYLYKGKVRNLGSFVSNTEVLDRITQHINNKETELKTLPTVFNFANTTTCNINCIMCSCKKAPAEPELLEKSVEYVNSHLATTSRIVLTGSGDPLACATIRKLLTGNDHTTPSTDTKFTLLTNGLLLPKYWDAIKHNSFSTIDVSVDAGTAETYEMIRRNARWSDLNEALRLISDNRSKFNSVGINMTVMKENYAEIPQFIELGIKYDIPVRFNEVRTAGDLDAESNIFSNQDGHHFKNFLTVIARAQQKEYPVAVNWGNLLQYARNASAHAQ
ncbi:radical SAM protein [Geomonas paludis]|uniref:Radical SAM protein n=2 Tax=Geomonas paludis TaxID=2740185 RepID=A0ABY4LIZ3_9BACT|nr:radical SAM protein [Geomonas paludis]UPU37091.1 radical SAM protein [Geomonas paludis]